MSKLDRIHFMVSLYNRTFLNDIEREEGLNTHEEILGLNSCGIPKFIKSNRLLIRLSMPLFVLLYSIKLFVFLVKTLEEIYIAKRICKYEAEKIFLYASKALPRVVEGANIKVEGDEKWLLLPWQKDFAVEGLEVITVFDLIKKRDAFSCFIDSLLVILLTYRKKSYKSVLAALSSFRWFLYNKAILKVPYDVELVFANHKDSYAPLFDNLPHQYKTLVQHGTEVVMVNPNNVSNPYYRYDKEGHFWVNNMPFKYKHLTKVYCFTPKELKALSMSILGNVPEVIIVGYPLKEFNENLDGDEAILIIGNYGVFHEKESRLLGLLQNTGVKIYLKNHPIYPASVYKGFLTMFDFVLLDGSRFPKVNYVFTYCSTLALEYEALGANIIFYDKMSEEDLRHTVDGVISKLISERIKSNV